MHAIAGPFPMFDSVRFARWARLLPSWSLRGSQHLLPWERFLERENVWRQVYGHGMSFGIFCLESWLAFTFQDIMYCHLVTLYVVSSSWWQAVWRINSTRPTWLFREFSAPLYGNPHDHCKCPHIFDQTPYIFLAIDHFNNVIREAVDKSEVETSLGPAPDTCLARVHLIASPDLMKAFPACLYISLILLLAALYFPWTYFQRE